MKSIGGKRRKTLNKNEKYDESRRRRNIYREKNRERKIGDQRRKGRRIRKKKQESDEGERRNVIKENIK